MHKNYSWLAFLFSIGLVAAWYTGYTLYDLYQYKVLNAQTKPKEIEWFVKKKSSDKFFVGSTYRYEINGVHYFGKTLLKTLPYRNLESAEMAKEEAGKKNWLLWYSEKSPQKSSLKKLFPVKSCVYCAILWSLFLYFVWLGFYVKKQSA